MFPTQGPDSKNHLNHKWKRLNFLCNRSYLLVIDNFGLFGQGSHALLPSKQVCCINVILSTNDATFTLDVAHCNRHMLYIWGGVVGCLKAYMHHIM